MTFQVPGDSTHPLNVQSVEFPFPSLAGKPEGAQKTNARPLFPNLPDGYTYTPLMSVRHGAPVVVTKSTDLPNSDTVKEIAGLLRSQMFVLRLLGEVRGEKGVLYYENGTGPFPEAEDEIDEVDAVDEVE